MEKLEILQNLFMPVKEDGLQKLLNLKRCLTSLEKIENSERSDEQV